VLRGRPTRNHWLALDLEGTESNRDGMGVKVQTGRQVRYATTSGSYLSASDGRVHFGLGTETQATVEITWPGGKRQMLENISVDRVLKVKEPE
ncbi:MAG: ASPIC/UnbV domain-containing protein, partial [Bryobacteraceae bacterium]